MLYRLVRFICKLILFVFFPPRVEGLSNVPDSGAVILAPNHIHWLDVMPVAVLVPRTVHFMAKHELFRLPPMAWLFHHLRAFPVHRGRADRKAVRVALDLLGQGCVLGLFPEGTRSRSGRLRSPELGVAMLALKTGSAVVPVAIHGPYRPFRQLRVEFCPPVDLSAFEGQRPNADVLWRASMDILQPVARSLGQDLPVREGTA